jgi:putative GTP pyrophosphokinase
VVRVDHPTSAASPPAGEDFRRFMLEHRFGMDEIVTKLSILRDEFAHLHDYNPIESVSSRLKSPESLLEKIQRKGLRVEDNPSFEAVKERVTDIAGVRVVCSFASDVYRVFDVICSQVDVTMVEVRDYIKNPKPNGYRSLHALVSVPVFLSGGAVPVTVEVQLRTIAMDFWASLEHKIYYKYRRDVPPELLDGLRTAADTAYALDATMEKLHLDVQSYAARPSTLVSPADAARVAGVDGPDALLLDSLQRLGSAERTT